MNGELRADWSNFSLDCIILRNHSKSKQKYFSNVSMKCKNFQ